jgi:hypothetical protein
MTAATVLLDVPRVLVALFACLIIPLALRAVALPRLSLAGVGAGALVAIALCLPPGTIATAITAPYALVAALAGLYGLRRALARWTDVPQLAMAAGLVGFAAAATWLVAHRAGIALLDYPPFWVLLTAAHFHIAATVLPIVIGWCAIERGRPARWIALGTLAGVPLTAAGIYVGHWLELVGAFVMAASAFSAAIVLLTQRGAPFALRLAGIPLGCGMILATMYALREHGTALVVPGFDPLSSMIITHGLLDTLFALLALLGIATAPRVRDVPPLSRLRGAFPVGATYFTRTGIERADSRAGGLVDAVADLDVDAATLAPAIRAFYEQTGTHELIVRPHWQRGFRRGARVWAAIARRLGQLQLPVAAESGREGIASRIVALDERADGRRGPRAWIRTYPDGRALYVAAYATHRDRTRAYMNIAFPLPAGQMSSVLRMVARDTGVTVSTRLGGDCGIWLVIAGLPIRLPLSETIDVWTIDDAAAPADLRSWAAGYTTIARHDLWLFGIHYLTLDYAMRPT